ncbi:putative E3 ubiquitin-protein ligase SDIR1 [Glarea lozoyensis 74030]|uniref:RING-type E3 ubiquitin transferase n=1 Tax=Glarea lozoyensis (strain ATCC 74030 / MF5533) TaxID=1104152 RepID=H0EG37_GLAL7|nr:putative E3 ubiquitin-protein ligase SDIR1 [Glarea lozoyensis 74030]
MLETLPIVKFGDPEPTKPGSRDVELENGSALSTAPTRTDPQESGTTTSKEANAVSTSATAVAEGGAAKDAPSGDAAASASSVQEGDLGCSICTEDFTTGEDVRVLPCNHKYHPACIDPWLLNVSGTCPLCRHDLRSDASANSEGASPTGNDELAPPLNEVADGTAQASEAANMYLDEYGWVWA